MFNVRRNGVTAQWSMAEVKALFVKRVKGAQYVNVLCVPCFAEATSM